ncbi:MAG TPA: UDP-glucuronic acid decarboxylase family protein [Patescibacteria group bacterium]|nr:UDP-glucuronic acid decarboxylase family protein [Patescibacteria group bacterium]
MYKILIAGGAGFIGSHLCKKLLDEGNTIYCLDNFLSGSKTNVQSLVDNPKFLLIDHDVSKSFDGIRDRFSDVHYIFHLASPASPNPKSERSYINHPIETMLANSLGTYHLLQLAKEKNAKFLFASTSEVYGNPSVSPQPETYFGNVNPNGIRSVYDEAKRFGEAMTFGFKRTHGVDVRIIRIFNTYGPLMQKDDGRAVSAFINQALTGVPITVFGDGKQTRSFCYVDDMVEGIIKAMFTDGTNGEVINLGNPDERAITAIATLVKDAVGGNIDIVHESLPEDDPLQRKPDITKAKQLLGWEPKVSFEEGLKQTIDYFRHI